MWLRMTVNRDVTLLGFVRPSEPRTPRTPPHAPGTPPGCLMLLDSRKNLKQTGHRVEEEGASWDRRKSVPGALGLDIVVYQTS